MENKLFREKSLNRISSPEDLTDYIKVTTPSVWMVLIAIILLLAGVCCWGIFGRVETKIDALVMSTDSYMYAIVDDSEAARISTGDQLRVEGRTYTVAAIGSDPLELTVAESSYLLHLLGKTENCWVTILSLSPSYTDEKGASGIENLPQGTYEGKVVIDSVNPISFVIN